MVMGILRHLRDDGIDIEIVAYVRRHDAWMKSAYIQWGLKHKTYKGNIKSFDEWATKGRAEFMKHLKIWIESFQDDVHVRNFDASGDVVADFMDVAEIDSKGIEKLRVYESPSNEELALRALFNSHYKGEVFPWRFNNVLNVGSLFFDETIDDWLAHMLPDQDTLDRIRDEYANDRAELNKLLKASGQPLMQAAQLPHKDHSLDTGKLLMALTQIVMSQAIKINRMQRDLSEIIKEDDNHE